MAGDLQLDEWPRTSVSAIKGSGTRDPATDSLDVSIVIPSHNRGARVKETVEKCLLLSPLPREIILVDDHSNDDSAQVLRELARGIVKYIRLPINEGPASARSIGFATAQGRYLVSLDDDSWFLENDALRRIWERLESLPNCGILALCGFSPGLTIEPSRERLTLVADHMTCGAAYRAEVLHKTGYHVAFLRYMGEESDLSVKVIDAGFDIVHDESIRFFHDFDPSKRSNQSLMRVRRLAVRNDLLRSWIYFPLDVALAVSIWRVGSHLVWGIRSRAVVATVGGYLDFILSFPRAIARRRPVRRDAALRYLALRRRPQLLQSE